ncbi:hypothetical protein BKI51_02450 [Alphaproteobacteria bacterium AO1-B]|nr:hypothetical protein BKI51_02450 [Alphaproteobacteria bacterium AO1-B]
MIKCTKLNQEIVYDWWKPLLNIKSNPQKGASVTIGTIDLPADFPGFDFSVEMYKTTGKPLYVDEKYNFSVHGLSVHYLVLKIIKNYKSVKNVFVDASRRDNPLEISLQNVVAGIYLLCDRFKVDVINLSNGLYRDEICKTELDEYDKALRYAASKGVVVVCAAGNDYSRGVAIPAALKQAIGVGSIGALGLGPSRSWYNFLETQSRNNGDALGKVHENISIFHDVSTSCGEGLDMVAPGVGIFQSIRHSVTNSVFDFELMGTSYAAPIVSAMLACKLTSKEEGFFTRNYAQWEKSMEILKSMCKPTGMPYDREGHGMPKMD